MPPCVRGTIDLRKSRAQMAHVVIAGCGVIGAAIAYELSQVPGVQVTVCDRQQPAQAATRAALGVLMGVISQKRKGNNLRMRLTGIQRYNTWVPQLEALTGKSIPYNQQGILRLCFEDEDLEAWQQLAELRQQQGWQLEIRDRAQLAADFPELCLDRVTAAVYSPQDRQIDPVALTQALVEAARRQGAVFKTEQPITAVVPQTSQTRAGSGHYQVQTTQETLEADWLIIAAGLGSTPLTAALQALIDIRPVLGQALRIRLPTPLGHPDFQPVITGEDTHLVPLGNQEYWLGATVEFDAAADPEVVPIAQTAALEDLWQRAVALCPRIATAEILSSWSGLRPRPFGRPAPIIEKLPGYENVLVASGHYRNGILLAPATAEKVREIIVAARSPQTELI